MRTYRDAGWVKHVVVILAVALVLGGCASKESRALFGGNYYPAKAKKVKGDRKSFVVNVRKVSQGLEGARGAGLHAGTRYCIENYGSSDIDWIKGPDGEDGKISTSKGDLVLTGRCRTW